MHMRGSTGRGGPPPPPENENLLDLHIGIIANMPQTPPPPPRKTTIILRTPPPLEKKFWIRA